MPALHPTAEYVNIEAGDPVFYQDIVAYQCIVGYKVVSGDTVRKCQADRSLNGSDIVCTSKYLTKLYPEID